MRPVLSFLKFTLWLIILAALFISQKGYSQTFLTKKNLDTVPYIRYGQVSTKFSKPTQELKKGQIVSNVLKIVTTIRKFDFKIALESLIFGLQTKNNFYGTLQAH